MELKDWLMTLIPVFCNGVVVFLLQKLFERKQTKKLILHEYYSVLRSKVDDGLELHAKATRMANEDNDDNATDINLTIQEFFSSCLDTYYYYVQNQIVFSAIKHEFDELSHLLLQLSKGVNAHSLSPIEISSQVNSIRDTLQEIKKKSMR